MADGSIGGAYFTLSVNTDDFKAQMGQAKSTAKSTADDVEQSTLQQVGAFKRLFGQVAGGIGTFAAFFAMGQKIGKMLRDNADLTEEWLKSIQSGAPEERLRAIAKELEDLQNASQGGLGNDIDNLIQGRSTARVRAKLEALQRERDALSIAAEKRQAEREKADAKKAAEEKARIQKAYDDETKQMEEDLLALRRAGADEETQHLYKAQDLNARLYDETDERRRAALEEMIELERGLAKKAADERLQKRIDEERSVAKARADEDKRLASERLRLEMDNVRRLEDYRRSIAQGFGVGDVATGDLGAIRRGIENLAASQITSRD